MRSGLFGVIRGFSAFGLLTLASMGLAACSSDVDPTPGAQGQAGGAGQAGAAGTAGTAGATGPAGPAAPAPTPPAPQAPKAVYTLSNDATANAVVVYSRVADGTLTPRDTYATGGRGSASGLGNQGALVFDAKQNAFFAVNAGDSSISMLSLKTDGSLTLVSKIGSGGVRPVSVTVSGGVVYTVNAGDAATPGNISGFRVSTGGLTRIEGSTQPLSAGSPTAPAQIEFTPDGNFLVVTEKATNIIDTYAVNAGVAAAPRSQASAGMTPFGFAFSAGKQLLVSEAFGGTIGAGAATSYGVGADGALSALSSSVVSSQSAPCWVTVALNHAFVTNTRSNTISTYTVAADGSMTLLGNGISAETGGGPIDADVSDGNDLLYTLNGRDHSISIFAIGAEGGLTKRPDFAGVPEFANGLVVR